MENIQQSSVNTAMDETLIIIDMMVRAIKGLKDGNALYGKTFLQKY